MTAVLPPPVQTYEQAIEYLFSRINYERAQPDSTGEFKLDRMRRLLSLLGDPHLKIPAVHIAGTKGKGSTAAMTAAILTAAGYRTGLYTSPHISRFEERMTVDGRMPSPDELVALVNAIAEPVAQLDGEPGHTSPTYFEIATAMAWRHFTDRHVDLVVLEVGLGGRLDATNLCAPLVTAITTISRDHTALLGNTLALIAGEKAGIIKPGIPVVSGVIDEEPRDVIEAISRERRAPLIQLGRDIRYEWTSSSTGAPSPVEDPVLDLASGGREPPGPTTERLSPVLRTERDSLPTIHVETPWRTWDTVPVPLMGEHQGANAALAVAIIDVLNTHGKPVIESAIGDGLPQVRWPVRIEKLCERPTVIVDAAHNWAAAAALVKTLEVMPCSGRRILVFAGTKDKDVAGLLRQLLPKFDSVILTQYLNNPRAVPVESLVATAQMLSAEPVHAAPDPATAWKLARHLAGPDDRICVTGSFFIAAEIRELVLDDLRRAGEPGNAGSAGETTDDASPSPPNDAPALTPAATTG